MDELTAVLLLPVHGRARVTQYCFRFLRLPLTFALFSVPPGTCDSLSSGSDLSTTSGSGPSAAETMPPPLRFVLHSHPRHLVPPRTAAPPAPGKAKYPSTEFSCMNCGNKCSGKTSYL
ncbi:hypothetical protein NDU88_000069 [Pleurodeles waltl]|uniref:Uncharacterized protein n=1 Tax=Pleurodeles waltl TaxID=8319 RepID=A0AAV7SVW0_PLEWA|nr:hypothetical protein NDU88_000069 [Pleurodeles waltl]